MWRRITSMISVFVVLVTTYILIYPAIAASKNMNLNQSSIEDQTVATDSAIRIRQEKKKEKGYLSDLKSEENPQTDMITTSGAITPSPFPPGTVLPDGTIVGEDTDLLSLFRKKGIQQGDMPDLQPQGEPYLLEDFLKSVSINGQTIQNNSEIHISNGDKLQLELNYEFPAKTLQLDDTSTKTENEKRNTFVYTIKGLNAFEYREAKIIQRVLDKDGNQELLESGIIRIGKKQDEDPNIEEQYKTAENKIFLIFDDAAIERNQKQKFDEGSIAFDALIAEVEVSDGGNLEISFSQEIKGSFKLSGTLNVEKSGEIIELDQAKIRYTAVITSPTGTGGEVKVTDSMRSSYPYYTEGDRAKRLHSVTNVSIVKKTKSSETALPDQVIAPGSTDFSFTLPRMKPAEEYHITYEAKLADHVNTIHKVEAINKITVEADNYIGATPEKLTDSATAIVSFQGRSLLVKSSGLVMVQENGQLREKVKWILKINVKHMDLDGWILTDHFAGKQFTGPVKIYRDSEGSANLVQDNVALPFTFNKTTVGNTKSTFIVVYYTDPPVSGSVRNIAYLEKGGLKAHSQRDFEKNTHPGILNKWFWKFDVEKYEESGENRFRLKLFWRITYTSSPDAPLKAPWVMYDRLEPTLSRNQYFSAEELSRINREVKSQLTTAGVSENSVHVEGTHERGTGRYGGFKIVGTEDIPPAKYISFVITSTDDLGTEGKGITGDGYQRDPYYNRATLTHNGKTNEPAYEKFTASAGIRYLTPIIKWDVDLETYHPGSSQNIMKKETVYNYYAKERKGEVYPLRGKDLLRWELRASVPYSYHTKHSMIIEDTLPEGLEFDKAELQIRDPKNDWQSLPFGSSNEVSINLGSHEIRASYHESERKMVLTYPEAYVTEMYQNHIGKEEKDPNYDSHPIRVRIGARIVDPQHTLPLVSDPSSAKAFRNEANLYLEKDGIRKQAGRMSQTKKVFRFSENEPLYKWHGHMKKETEALENNRIHYTLLINSSGKRMLPAEGAVLSVEDLFSYKTDIDNIVIVKLDRNSVKVYEDTGIGENIGSSTDKQLIESDAEEPGVTGKHFRYRYSENRVTLDSELHTNNKIRFRIPDGKRLRIEYDYEILQGKQGQDFSATNLAKLTGHVSLQGSNTSVLKAKIGNENSSYSLKGIYFQKYGVDKLASGEQNRVVLPNAKFEIHEYKGANEQGEDIYEPIKDDKSQNKVFTTDQRGKLYFEQYQYNTAYKLVEIEVPEGYIKQNFEFFVFHINHALYPDKMPEGFKKKQGVLLCYNLMTQEIENEKNEVDIIIEKIWRDPYGRPLEKQSGNIDVKLWRSVDVYNEKGELRGERKFEPVKTIKLNAPSWTFRQRKYPKRDQTDPTKEKRYHYYIEELTGSFATYYDVTYNKTKETGITEGKLEVTNKQKWIAALPETGGGGTMLYYIFGFGMIIIVLPFFYHFKRGIPKNK